MKPNNRTKDLDEFEAEIKKWTEKLIALEVEKEKVSATDSRFEEILREKNNIRIKLKAIQVRMGNLGSLDKFAKDVFSQIPKF